MSDPVASAARAALAGQHGAGLAADVEAALHGRPGAQRPGQYLDPVGLGTLIVAIATLAWTVYADLRKKTPEPPAEVVARQVRIEMRSAGLDGGHHDAGQITQIVVTEITRTAAPRG